MTKHILALLPVLAVTALPVPSHAGDTAALRALRKQQALLAKLTGTPAYASLLAPDFALVAPDGRVITWAQQQAQSRNAPALPGLKVRGRKTESVSIAPDGEGVVLTSEDIAYHEKDTPGTLGPKGQDHTWRIVQTNQFTWEPTPAGWRLRRMAAVKVRVLIDGKLSPPPAALRPQVPASAPPPPAGPPP